MIKRCRLGLIGKLGLALLATGGAASQPGLAQGITVGSGSALSLGSGQIDLGCGSLIILSGGQVDGGQGTINLSGNWSNSGTFDPGSSTVNMADGSGCGSPVTIAGNTTFHNLVITTNSGRQVNFAAGSTQTVTSALTLAGVAGNLLKIRSTTQGSPAFLDLTSTASQNIDYVDVQDNHATGLYLASGDPGRFNSVDSGGNLRWFLNAGPTDIPTLSSLGMLATLMGLLMAVLGWRRRLEH